MLVVVSIVGLLLGLLVPAVMSARESARRAHCSNQLHQIGLALNSHQAALQVYPPPMPARSLQKGIHWASSEGVSGYYELLPFLELSPLYNAINVGGDGTPFPIGFDASSPVNATAFQHREGLFVCPSDSDESSQPKGPISYRFNVGSSFPLIYTNVEQIGAFQPALHSRPSDFLDGLSQTAGLCERLTGSQSMTRFNRQRNFWGAGVSSLFPISNDQQVLDLCRSLANSPADFTTRLGDTWMKGGNDYVWYNHVAPPNDRGADCVAGDMNTQEPRYCEHCSMATRSFHPGGVNCLMMDGSVRFVRDGISPTVWRALGTRSGNDVASSAW